MRIKHFWSGWITLVASILIIFTSATVSAQVIDPEQTGGPTALIITYRSLSVNRASFRESVEKTDIDQFEKWKSAGVFESYRLLFNWYADENTWDMMAIIGFHKYTDLARWKDIERTSPGGLSPGSLRFGAPTNTYSADLGWHQVSPELKGNSRKSVFFVVPYDVPNLEEYKPYAGGYVVPQMKGWIREGILSSYSLYLNRFYMGKPWDAMLILEYKDLESFGLRESVKDKVRAALSADPTWKAFSENKKMIRTEKEIVLADELTRR